MVQSRRTVGLDRDLMEKFKEVARKRGMGIAPYLRKLLNEALEIERMGFFAPRALKERRLQIILEMFNFGYIPLGIDSDRIEVRAYGRRLGEMIKEIGGDVYSIIEYLGTMHKIAIAHEDRITILNPAVEGARDIRYIISEILKGMAEGARLSIKITDNMAVIEMPKELREELRKRVEDEITKPRGRR